MTGPLRSLRIRLPAQAWEVLRRAAALAGRRMEDYAAETVVRRGVRDLTGPLLSETLQAATTAEDVLEEITYVARAVVPGAALASVVIRAPDGAYSTAASTGPAADDLDRLQFDSGGGPWLDVTGPNCLPSAGSADLAEEPVWPGFAEAAIALGYCSALSVALGPAAPDHPGGPQVALNLYAPDPGALGENAAGVALLIAVHARAALATVGRRTAVERREANLRAALESRDVIGQAKGLLMERYAFTADQAFQALRHASQNLNIKVAELAAVVADGHRRPPSESEWLVQTGEIMEPEVREMRMKALYERIRRAQERAEEAAARTSTLTPPASDGPAGSPAELARQAAEHAEQARDDLRDSVHWRVQALLSAAAAHARAAAALESDTGLSRPVDLAIAAWHRGQAVRDLQDAHAAEHLHTP